jgi:hypothetical protein
MEIQNESLRRTYEGDLTKRIVIESLLEQGFTEEEVLEEINAQYASEVLDWE